ncbi:hypothetical protein [Shewanella baltica]|uniref:hypothetical protein n=1 Tax=Shewanella baltica TaxID=62322 RepID=UPI0001E4E183|nr:hypothetical protein [Shewanella baltica]AEG13542.1 hypothetical protein Sbal175_4325 [Shewanella baltica BA175]EHC04151.1 hypothetical protein Sbal625DRAFT_4111 [Shewanella baltica OS625]KZK68654.1 hypothetical protein A1L58_18040 [Shewanella baltica]
MDANLKTYSKVALDKIKDTMKPRDLYLLLYEGQEPSKEQLQTFRNRLNGNRASPSLEFVGQCVNAVPSLHGMTLREFFDLNDLKKK